MDAIALPTHRIGKPFVAFGASLSSGAPIDATEWPEQRVGQLERLRYLVPLTPAESVQIAAQAAAEPEKTGKNK